MRLMIPLLKNFTHIYLICGENDVKSSDAENILHNYEMIIRALQQLVVRVGGIMPRADIPKETRQKYNLIFAGRLEDRLKSSKRIKPEDFNKDIVLFTVSTKMEESTSSSIFYHFCTIFLFLLFNPFYICILRFEFFKVSR